ncbi:serine/threonine-protein kinase Nek5-like isoform X2 [Ruditapes philippinarum]|uniref:serine/threonine-protein kinase Nek5-like isoform X2 n=1 Tax=Ruditapes philippinarum TaxID=129788 RepID=UPI00295BCE3F|nr:serine/threonine-protein kinase Nek5-like isoform X2 [Ruditapes philippinarum]
MATAKKQYSEKELIGKGTFGKIYKAKKQSSKGFEDFVAIKEIDLTKCTEKDKEHVQQEAEVMQTFHHENLVKFIESFCTGRCLTIVMELCNKGNLRTLIADKKGLDEEQFISTLTKIVRGLKYLHDKGIIHRDIKTTNILLHEQNGECQVKIADFGLAKMMSMSSPTVCVGSPYFMSPEMISGKEYDMSTDIWSLGCCAYEMATTKVPYGAKHFESLRRKKNEGVVDYSEIKYCSLMRDLISGMMEKNPSQRPKIGDVLTFVEQHDLTTHTNKTQVKDGRRKEHQFAKTCPDRISSYPIQPHETSGYDTHEENRKDEVLKVRVPVKMTKEEEDWYLKADQLQKDVKERLPDKGLMEKINAAINRTKHMDNEDQFLADMEKLLDCSTYKKCRPDLKALWAYQTEILKKEFKIAF